MIYSEPNINMLDRSSFRFVVNRNDDNSRALRDSYVPRLIWIRIIYVVVIWYPCNGFMYVKI